MTLPKIISVDDHVVEPPDLWTSRMPTSLRDRIPHVRREFGGYSSGKYDPNVLNWTVDPDLPSADWADVWYYDDMVWPLTRGLADSGYTTEDPSRPITYDEVLPGTYQRDARLDDMAANHTDVSLCFPTVPRFCGQIFMERTDKEVGLLGVQAYNDWMIEDWCGDTSRPERLIPNTLIPLWDAQLAAAEVRRCAAKGSHSIAFSECPPYLGLPSLYSDYWNPLFEACQETDTVINMHIGSSSKLIVTAPDAPVDTIMCLSYVNALLALTDWLYTGTLERYPDLRIALSESQAGWVPFAAQRADTTWTKANEKFHLETGANKAKELPSKVIPGRVFFCIFDDLEGLRLRDEIGVEQLLFETDYPHTDSTFPDSQKTAEDLCRQAGLSEQEIYQVMRGNAIKAYRLDKYFGILA
jgi:predicted TIM-barrel fold metal-dependent hydrolase